MSKKKTTSEPPQEGGEAKKKPVSAKRVRTVHPMLKRITRADGSEEYLEDSLPDPEEVRQDPGKFSKYANPTITIEQENHPTITVELGDQQRSQAFNFGLDYMQIGNHIVTRQELLDNPDNFRQYFTGEEKVWLYVLHSAFNIHKTFTTLTKAQERRLKQIERELGIDRGIIDRLHKQHRALLKTVAKNISKSSEEPSLFHLPQNFDKGALGGYKEEISKNTGALAFYLMQLYQQNGNKTLEIDNLSPLAEVLKCNNYRLKLYLLYLGGYVYPIVDVDENTRELVLTNEQLFKIQFHYRPEIAKKYDVGRGGVILGVDRIGSDFLTFIKNEEVTKVVITPSERLTKGLQGKGLGNILTVNDKFVSLILELSDIATKLLSYSSSNRPEQKIKEDRLIEHLNLAKQVKKQGKPRIRETIFKGLKELQDKKHIISYEYDPGREMFSFTYSDKFVKYKETKRQKGDTPIEPQKRGKKGG
jgi:hypothetical protein